MNREVELIYENVELCCEIHCTNCGKTGTAYGMDDFEGSEYFGENGWRATIYCNIYCPTCATKKLKSKK